MTEGARTMGAIFIETRSRKTIGAGGKQSYSVRWCAGAGQDARNGAVLCPSTREPVYGAARALCERGETGRIEIWADYSEHMIGTVDIERGARWTISETDRHGPRRVKWTPRPELGP